MILPFNEKNVTFRKEKKGNKFANKDANNGENSSTSKDEKNNKKKNRNFKKDLKVEIIGDSMLNGIEEGDISGLCKVKISRYPGCTSNDLVHHAIPLINKNPNVIICHAETNDLTNDEDTITNLTSIVNRIKRKCPLATIAISSVITRKDKKELENRAAVLNKELMRFCDDNLIDFHLK